MKRSDFLKIFGLAPVAYGVVDFIPSETFITHPVEHNWIIGDTPIKEFTHIVNLIHIPHDPFIHLHIPEMYLEKIKNGLTQKDENVVLTYMGYKETVFPTVLLVRFYPSLPVTVGKEPIIWTIN